MPIKNPQAPSKALLTVKDLAAQLGISTSSIYRKRSQGESLPRTAKLSSSVLRWRQADVDAWVADQLEDEEVAR